MEVIGLGSNYVNPFGWYHMHRCYGEVDWMMMTDNIVKSSRNIKGSLET